MAFAVFEKRWRTRGRKAPAKQNNNNSKKKKTEIDLLRDSNKLSPDITATGGVLFNEHRSAHMAPLTAQHAWHQVLWNGNPDGARITLIICHIATFHVRHEVNGIDGFRKGYLFEKTVRDCIWTVSTEEYVTLPSIQQET